MRFGSNAPNGFVIRPSAILVIVYVGVLGIAQVYTLATAKFPEIGASEPPQLISTPHSLWLSAGCALLMIALGLDLRNARAAPPGVARAQVVGIALAAVILAMTEVAILLGSGVIAF